MKSTLVIGILILTIAACTKTDDSPVKLTEIREGILYGNGEEGFEQGNLIITKQSDWSDFMSEINSVNNETDNFNETSINFNEFIVVACFDPVRSSGGYSIRISELKEKADKIELTVENTAPNGIATTVITQPYYVAKINKTDLPVVFN